MQHSAFQIKAIFFEITKHLFDPHATLVKAQSDFQVRQTGCQKPGFFLAFLPVR